MGHCQSDMLRSLWLLTSHIILAFWNVGNVDSSTVQQMRFTMQTSNSRFSNATLGSVNLSSQIECGMECARTSGCIAFSSCSIASTSTTSCRLENRLSTPANTEFSEYCNIFMSLDKAATRGINEVTLPDPDYYWDLSGKCSVDDACTSGTLSCNTNVIYANIGDRSGQALVGQAPRVARIDGVTGNSVCAMDINGVTDYHYLTLGDFSGRCVLNTDLCSNGITVGLWTLIKWEDMAPPKTWHLVSSGDETFSKRGIALSVVHPESTNYTIIAQVRGPSNEYLAAISYTQSNVPGCSGSPPSSCNWIHIAFTWHPSDQVYLYVNGVQVMQGTATAQTNYEAVILDLHINKAVGTSTEMGNVAYSDLKIFEQVLDSDQIRKLYTS